jgi:hypothetical protein
VSAHCPNCQAERPAGATECPRCGIIYEKFLKRQASQAAAPCPGSSLPAKRGLTGPASAALALASAAAAAWLLHSGSGLPVPEGALSNEKLGFAAAEPPGFTADWSEHPSGEGTLVGVLKGTFEGGYAPELRITVIPRPALKVTADLKDKLAESFFGPVRGSVDRWSQESVRVVQTDLLESLRVDGGGPKHVSTFIPPKTMNPTAALNYLKQKNPGQQMFWVKEVVNLDRIGPTPSAVVVEEGRTEEKDLELLSGGVLVPGRERTYLLSYVCDKAQQAECAAAFDSLARSFRVLLRTRPLDSLISGR